jgi:polyisoprenoid-binding protein YceI
MSATIQQLPAGTFTVDPVHSTAEFAVKHMGINTFRTGFDQFEATLADGVLTGRVPVASVRIANPDFKAHVLAADFFDAERHPELTFTSTAIELAEDGTTTVRGDLTIKGTTLPVTGTGTIAGPVVGLAGRELVAVDLEAEVDRTAFGLTWQAELPGGGKALGERVTLVLHLELVGQEA